jgi:hypothetical protein
MMNQNESIKAQVSHLKCPGRICSHGNFNYFTTNKVSGRNIPESRMAGANERVNIACCGIGNQGGL